MPSSVCAAQLFPSPLSPTVVLCHDFSRRVFSVSRKSALRARIVRAVRCASVFNLVHCECPFREKRLPFQPSASVMTAPRRGSAIFHRRHPGPDQAGPLQSPGYPSASDSSGRLSSTVVISLPSILILNAGVFVAFVKQFRAEIHDRSPPTVLLISLKADVAVSCRLFSCELRSPNISDRDSSTRLSDRVNSIRRGIPSRKNPVLV
ncbi:hypothetical protein AMUR21_00003 [Escherichia coli]|nr:hypothetical protein AMUR21_00003 [Escherichia coli]